MSDELTMVPPPQVREAWPMVRDRIAAIAAACNEPWIAEDVFQQLVTAQAFLWGTFDLAGFLVLQVAQQPYGNELHCWICSNSTDEPPVAYWGQLQDIARNNACVRITFENDRRGFQRHIPGLRVRYRYSADVA